MVPYKCKLWFSPCCKRPPGQPYPLAAIWRDHIQKKSVSRTIMLLLLLLLLLSCQCLQGQHFVQNANSNWLYTPPCSQAIVATPDGPPKALPAAGR
eukprot:547164-Pelagomonas_calceolata.AAC.2